MAVTKRASRINELENELRGLDHLLGQLESVDVEDHPKFLLVTGYLTEEEVKTQHGKVTASLWKAKGEQDEMEEKADPASAEKFPRVDIPDNALSPDQLKEKRRQVFLKTTTEGRQRARQKRLEEESLKEKQTQQEEEKRLENPELYLQQLRAKYKGLLEKLDQKKRLKANGKNGNGDPTSGNFGRGERLNAAHKERMRLLTTAAFDRGKGEDTFGARDEDWQLYKLMSKDNDEDEGPDEDESEIARISSRLQDIDPTFKPEPGLSQPTDAPRVRIPTKEDFQILMEVERFRCREVLFNRSIIGIDQSGLDEMVGVSLRRFSSKSQSLDEQLTSSILLTGGNTQFPGLSERLEARIRMIRPCGTTIKVIKANDPIYDAWRGASTYAASVQFHEQTFSRMDYYEKGEDWLRQYKFRYTP